MRSDAPELDAAVRRLWNWHCVGHQAAPAHVMVCFGGNDLRVARHAAQLMREGMAQWLVVSGGVAHQDDLLKTAWAGTECEAFTQEILAQGVAPQCLIAEPRARNTAENLRFSREALAQRGLAAESLLLVCKPHMQRRILATAAVEWPEVPYRAASFTLALDAYCTDALSKDYAAQLMVGDLQRLQRYPAAGFCAPQRVPDEVLAASQALIAAGFDRHLL